MHDDRKRAGFKRRTRVAAARERILSATEPHRRTVHVPLVRADERALAERLTAPNPVPGYDRAAMDGYAVRARDTFGASDRSPAVLEERDGAVGPGEAVRVHTGSELPPGADSVVMIEQVEAVGGSLEVFDAVTDGENVGDVGEDVAQGQLLYEEGHRLRPSDMGLLRSVGLERVPVFERPTVGVVPTGEELVEADPDPGEVIETNGLTVSTLVSRWGGDATYRNIVTDDFDALRAAIQRDLTKDIVVTTGGSSVGERDLLPEVIDELGEVLVHGVALKPGHPVALGLVEETPVLALPGYPVACIVNAVQFLRPVLKRAGGMPIDPPPTREATLDRKVTSEPGTRTFVRVEVHDAGAKSGKGGGGADQGGSGAGEGGSEAGEGGDDAPGDEVGEGPGNGDLVATPVRSSGSGILSSVALADGWVVVPESREGIPAGERVAVEDWEWSA